MRKIYFSISLVFLLVVFISPLANSLAADSDQNAAVRNTVNGFAEAWNRHDVDALAALLAPNADFVNVTGQWWKANSRSRRTLPFFTPRSQKVGQV